jgi:hypothetical protein
MTHEEWWRSTDVPAMLEALWDAHGGEEAALVPQLHRYFVACCRRIWRLLPQQGSRRGIEVAERYLAGAATDEELSAVNWDAEGAAFNIDYNCDPEAIERWVAEVRAIPPQEMAALLDPPGVGRDLEPRQLLKRAAYFADYAMIYPHLTPKRPVPRNYVPFLSAELLRQQFGGEYPARRKKGTA